VASIVTFGYLPRMDRFAAGAVGLCVVGAALGWLRVAPPLVGFGIFALGGLGAVLAGVATIVRLLRGRAPSLGGVLALLVAIGVVVAALPGVGMPRINDFTTDLEDPPAFTHAAMLGPNVGRNMSYPAKNAALQLECCSDLRAAMLEVPPAEAFGRAVAVASAMPGWEVTSRSPEDGTIEAVATTRIFGFHDDVAIRVRPATNGGSRIDVRSKSRDGQGDLGANAARIRKFVATIEGDA
jgi:uncharacterized protein (DUF1499 family)